MSVMSDLPDAEDWATYLIRNQTPSRLEIVGTDAAHTLKLAPLQQVHIDYRPNVHLGLAAVHARADRAVAWEKEPVRSTRVYATAWLTLIAAVSIIAAILLGLNASWSWWPATLSAVALLCIGIAIQLNRPNTTEDGKRSTGKPENQLQGSGGQRSSGWRFTKDVALSAAQKLALLIVLAVGILGPTAAIYYGSELSGILPASGWLQFDLVTDDTSYPIIVARGMQIVLVVILALIPGLMYFQFDREKLSTLVDRWLHHAFRLDPTLHTISDVDAKYGRRVEEFYGASFDCGVEAAKKRTTTTRSPLYVATLLLVLGWIVVLLNSPVDLSIQGGSLVREAAPTQDLPAIQRFIQPAYTPMTCAFLGAYFFAVQVTLLGYVRGDLRPKTYNVVTVRILVAVILAWMLHGLFGSPNWVMAASFLGGIVPDTVLRYIRDVPTRVKRRTAKQRDSEPLDEFADRSPLLALDGIDIYERTRLAEEGITSVQALARHDLVDLMLSSRIPASRLIDWLDQALLYQHVTTADRQKLRNAGIRTATELIGAYEDNERKSRLIKLLDDGQIRVSLIVGALRDDEWLSCVTYWRLRDDTHEPGRIIYTARGLQPPLASVTDAGSAA